MKNALLVTGGNLDLRCCVSEHFWLPHFDSHTPVFTFEGRHLRCRNDYAFRYRFSSIFLSLWKQCLLSLKVLQYSFFLN